jgi:hypothetical protein
MESAVATIIGAAIGAAAGISGGLLVGWRQGRIEHDKWLRSREDAIAADLRATLHQLTIKVAAAVHSMCWLTWLAREGPDRLSQARIDAYDAEMHVLLPEITGLQAAVAAIDGAAFGELSAIIESVIQADWRVGTAGLQFVEREPKSAKDLAACYEMTLELHRALPSAVAAVISRRAGVPVTSVRR